MPLSALTLYDSLDHCTSLSDLLFGLASLLSSGSAGATASLHAQRSGASLVMVGDDALAELQRPAPGELASPVSAAVSSTRSRRFSAGGVMSAAAPPAGGAPSSSIVEYQDGLWAALEAASGGALPPEASVARLQRAMQVALHLGAPVLLRLDGAFEPSASVSSAAAPRAAAGVLATTVRPPRRSSSSSANDTLSSDAVAPSLSAHDVPSLRIFGTAMAPQRLTAQAAAVAVVPAVATSAAHHTPHASGSTLLIPLLERADLPCHAPRCVLALERPGTAGMGGLAGAPFPHSASAAVSIVVEVLPLMLRRLVRRQEAQARSSSAEAGVAALARTVAEGTGADDVVACLCSAVREMLGTDTDVSVVSCALAAGTPAAAAPHAASPAGCGGALGEAPAPRGGEAPLSLPIYGGDLGSEYAEAVTAHLQVRLAPEAGAQCSLLADAPSLMHHLRALTEAAGTALRAVALLEEAHISAACSAAMLRVVRALHALPADTDDSLGALTRHLEQLALELVAADALRIVFVDAARGELFAVGAAMPSALHRMTHGEAGGGGWGEPGGIITARSLSDDGAFSAAVAPPLLPHAAEPPPLLPASDVWGLGAGASGETSDGSLFLGVAAGGAVYCCKLGVGLTGRAAATGRTLRAGCDAGSDARYDAAADCLGRGPEAPLTSLLFVPICAPSDLSPPQMRQDVGSIPGGLPPPPQHARVVAVVQAASFTPGCPFTALDTALLEAFAGEVAALLAARSLQVAHNAADARVRAAGDPSGDAARISSLLDQFMGTPSDSLGAAQRRAGGGGGGGAGGGGGGGGGGLAASAARALERTPRTPRTASRHSLGGGELGGGGALSHMHSYSSSRGSTRAGAALSPAGGSDLSRSGASATACGGTTTQGVGLLLSHRSSQGGADAAEAMGAASSLQQPLSLVTDLYVQSPCRPPRAVSAATTRSTPLGGCGGVQQAAEQVTRGGAQQTELGARGAGAPALMAPTLSPPPGGNALSSTTLATEAVEPQEPPSAASRAASAAPPGEAARLTQRTVSQLLESCGAPSAGALAAATGEGGAGRAPTARARAMPRATSAQYRRRSGGLGGSLTGASMSGAATPLVSARQHSDGGAAPAPQQPPPMLPPLLLGRQGSQRGSAEAATEAEAAQLEDAALRPWLAVVPRRGRELASAALLLDHLRFDPLDLDAEELLACAVDMVHLMDLPARTGVALADVEALARSARALYRSNPYHNFAHALSVMHVCFVALRRCYACAVLLAPEEQLAVLLAALCHDVDHPGVSNSHEASTLSGLALRYNDQSILEQHHAATMFELLMGSAGGAGGGRGDGDGDGAEADGAAPRTPPYDPSSALLSTLQLPCAVFGRFRAAAIAAILATDMRHHDALTSAARGLRPGREALADVTPKLLIELIVHAADLSNPVLGSFAAVQQWAERVCAEFTAQVARERELGLPIAPHMDGLHSPTALAKMQLGFLDYVVSPLWSTLTATLLPELAAEIRANLTANRDAWAARVAESRKEGAEEKS